MSYVPLIAPATSETRLKLLCKIADSFIYVVSRMGVTGATGTLNTELPKMLEKVHVQAGNIPTAVGFGVSTRDHFLSVGKIADGVVIGSQIITTLANAPAGKGAEAVRKYCAEISGRDSQIESMTREVGIVEAIAEAKEPNGVSMDKVIRDGVNGHEADLADQLEAVNMNGDSDPSVGLPFGAGFARLTKRLSCFDHVLASLVASMYQSHSWIVWPSSRRPLSRRGMMWNFGKNIVVTIRIWVGPVSCILPID